MMLGELDYDRSYVETSDEQHFPIINLIMLVLFAIIMPILLIEFISWFSHWRSYANSTKCTSQTSCYAGFTII